MVFSYKCSCGNYIEIERSIKEKSVNQVKCSSCGKMANRDWKASKIHIPESFKTTSNLYNRDDAADISYISNRLNRNRPSGRRKAVY